MSSGACGAPGSNSSGNYSTSEEFSSESNREKDMDSLTCFAAPVSALPAAPVPQTTSRGRRIARMSDQTAAAMSSQQVVIDLKCICKELVENALDAGATSIEIRLMDCGLGGVEVRDNGSGISPQDLDVLGCRHATSKITNFEDIYSKLDTLGFRGEALASLCFVARVSIVTRCRSADFGTRVFFDSNGKQVAREATAREVGTTVSVEDIFGRMPLRRRTMEQTKQRQLQDALALLQRIALLHATSCRIVLSNFDPNTGNRSTFLATKGTSSGLLEAALTVYGSKQLAACTELTLSGTEPGREWRLEVVISRPPHGVRSANLQHFFVKRRAVEFPPLLQKLLNKKWKEVSSRGLFPVCLAFLELDASLVDVNLRKDKQQVLLAVERDVAQALLEAIGKILAPSVGSFEFEASKKQRQLIMKSCAASQLPADSQKQQCEEQATKQQEQQRPEHQQQEQQRDQKQQPSPPQQRQGEAMQLHNSQENHRRTQGADRGKQQHKQQHQTQAQYLSAEEPRNTSAVVRGHEEPSRRGSADADDYNSLSGLPRDAELRKEPSMEKTDRTQQSSEPSVLQQRGNEAAEPLSALPPTEGMHERRPLTLTRHQRVVRSNSGNGDLKHQGPPEGKKDLRQSLDTRSPEPMQEEAEFDTLAVRSTSRSSCEEVDATGQALAGPQHGVRRAGAGEEANFLVEEILAAAVGECSFNLNELYSVECDHVVISDTDEEVPSSIRDAEWMSETPSPVWSDTPTNFSLAGDARTGIMGNDPDFFLFKKDFFRDLTLVGQFNEGFIIAAIRNTRRPSPNRLVGGRHSNSTQNASNNSMCDTGSGETVTSLFIIDQHASDEKRIFEALNAECRPRMQPLIAPLRLTLPAELIAAVEAFTPHLTSNGFACVICGPSGPPKPLQFSQLMVIPASQCSTIVSTAGAQPASPPSFTFASQQQLLQSTACTGRVASSLQRKEQRNDACDTSQEEEEREVNAEGRHCFLTGLPVIEGRQLSASDFIEFLAALASEDQGKAMWKGTMPPPLPPLAAKEAASRQSPQHHRVLQYRPSRVWDILASKACRSAVMIGDPLAPHKQIAILRRMADLQLPFNCPHGRPTMRHLVNLVDGARQEEGCLSHHKFQDSSACSIEQSEDCREQHSVKRDSRQHERTKAAQGKDIKMNEYADASCRQKRPAPATRHCETEERGRAEKGSYQKDHCFVAPPNEDGNPAKTNHSASARAVSDDDDFSALFSDDDDLVAQSEDPQDTGRAPGTRLRGRFGEEDAFQGGLDTVTEVGLAGLRLTFIE